MKEIILEKLADENSMRINVNLLPPGIYFINTTKGVNKKFVKL